MRRGMLWDLFQLDIGTEIQWHSSLAVDEMSGPKYPFSIENSADPAGVHFQETSNDQLGSPYSRNGQIIGVQGIM
jgi:hypothetical protein